MIGIDLGIDNLARAEVIGRGGFSIVYAATDTLLDRRVAVKVLGPLGRDRDRDRFERECRVMARLSAHPNVVTLHNAGYTREGRPYLVMELVTGGNLADLLSTGPVPWADAVRYLIPVVDAVASAHRAGVLHQDIKPENILLAGEEPQLTDFGIARYAEATAVSETVAASWLHAPPELFGGRRDERSDIYSLASTLHTLIAGTPPFWSADDEGIHPLLYRVVNEPAPPLDPDLAPEPLQAVVLRGLAKNPADRQATADEMAAGLRAVVEASPSAPSRVETVVVPLSSPVLQSPHQPIAGPRVDTEAVSHPGPGDVPRVESMTMAAPAAMRLMTGPRLDAPVVPAVMPPPRSNPRRRSGPWRVAGAGLMIAVMVPSLVVMALYLVGLLTSSDPATGRGDTAATEAVLVGDEIDEVVLHPPGLSAVFGLALTAEGRLLIADSDGMVASWVSGGPEDTVRVQQLHDDGIHDIIVLSDGRFATASEDGTAALWDSTGMATSSDSELEPDVVLAGHAGAVWGIAELPDGRLITVGDDGAALIWNLATPDQPVAAISHHADGLRDVVVLSDGRVATAGLDSIVQVWSPDDPTAAPVTFAEHTSGVQGLAVLADGRVASTGIDQTVRIWDPTTGASSLTYTIHQDILYEVLALSDGRIASASADNTVQIWDPGTGAPQLVYSGHGYAPGFTLGAAPGVNTLTELPDGRIATGGVDGTIRIWTPS